jgi:ADP-ribosylation factor-like protein 2
MFIINTFSKLFFLILKKKLKRLAGATLLVFSNKQDIVGSLTAEEICNLLELNNITTHHWQIQGCSAVTGENLVEGIDWLVQDIASRIFTLD